MEDGLPSDPQDLLNEAMLILRGGLGRKRRRSSDSPQSSSSVNFVPCCEDLNVSLVEDHQDLVSLDSQRRTSFSILKNDFHYQANVNHSDQMIVMEKDFVSSLRFVSSSFTPNGASSGIPIVGYDSGANHELLNLPKLSGSLEKLLVDSAYDNSDTDAEIVVEGTSVGINRCILASRSPFFHDLFKASIAASSTEGKPKYFMKDFDPYGKIGYEVFMAILNYLYTGKLKPSTPEVSTCVDKSCAHGACGPAIDYAVELMYASATFQMKELVMLIQAFVEDIVPIILVAHHCELSQLLSHCIQRLARSDLDDLILNKELPHEVLIQIKTLRKSSIQDFMSDMPDMRIRRIHKALYSDDIELVKLFLDESDITLDDACALHYAAAYCNSKVVRELLSMDNCDLNLRNCRGYTVLHVAARRMDPSIIVGLLSKGASVSETTSDGRTAITICQRLTRPKDYFEKTKQGEETNTDRMCIDVLQREMLRNPLACDMSVSSEMVADDLLMSLSLFEDRVALARVLFPREAKLAMQIANADSTSEFTGLSESKTSCANLREVDLNEIPSEQVKRLKLRLQALQKTVKSGRRFFPHCSEVLDNLEDAPHETMPQEDDPPEKVLELKNNPSVVRYMELKNELLKAFNEDKAVSGVWAADAPQVH